MISKSGTSSTYYVRDNKGHVIGERTPDGGHWYYLKDGLGSVVAVVSSDGSQIGARFGYDPYGKSTYQSGAVSNPWKFAGGYLDSTGLYKFGMQYYDPALGRWTQQDPIAGSISNPSTVNRYLYIVDDPINATDATGAACNNLLLEAAGVGIVAAGITALAIASPAGIVVLGALFTQSTLIAAGGAFGLGAALLTGYGLFGPSCS